jgi:hypothetical protein
MTTTSWTSADVAALERAIADGRGARTIAFDNQSVTFNSIDDMLRLLAVMRQAVEAASSTGTPRTRYGAVGKGV